VGLDFWSSVATVWLAFLCFIGLIVVVVASVFAVKGMHVAVDRTPRLMRQAQGYSRTMRTQVDSASKRLVEPVIQAHSRTHNASTVLGRLFRRSKTQGRGETKQ